MKCRLKGVAAVLLVSPPQELLLRTFPATLPLHQIFCPHNKLTTRNAKLDVIKPLLHST